MKNIKRLTAVVLLFAMVFTVLTANTFAAETQPDNQTQVIADAEYMDSVRDLIRQKYSGVIPEDALNKATTFKAMFDTLDDYSAFYDVNEINTVLGALSGSVEGVGIQVEQAENDKYITVLKVYKNSPAWKAGVLSGDKIAEVDGKSVAGQSLDTVVSKVKGTVGTKVKLGLIRQGAKKIMTLEMPREQIDIPTVHYELRGNIGYILIDTFSNNTYSGVDEALEYFDSKKITRLVLDLRNNPGGYVDQAVLVAKRFVPKGLITKLDYKDETEMDQSYYSSLTKLKYKLTVLVNEYSASASEIFTGAVKDTDAGVIIGNKTFGKAKVQTFFPILNKEAFIALNQDNEVKTVNGYDFGYPFEDQLSGYGKMTVGLYYTPSGECIDLKGIEPDVKVKDNEVTADNIPVNFLEPTTITVKPALGTQYMDVFYAECILKLLNYKVDKPDITLDSKTFEAIKKFQKDNKLYSYGVLDFSTQKLLNSKLQVLKQTKDPVYAKAALLLKN
ncbi:MAG: C-terminal processing peptidase [Eubacterium sp.]|nr:C-terminal processing peptidase [Eubacterium sp.]